MDTVIEEGSLVAITGPSGSGKTTFLRIIAGLATAKAGEIRVNETIWFSAAKGINLPPQKRKIGYVFQNYALFPNMTVRENLNFALEKNQSTTIIEELMETMELTALAESYPNYLSGGQQQRVALARALVRKPQILLLDEPLSALDVDLRQKLQTFLLKIHQRYQITTLLVSHDLEEIMHMANRVIVLKSGKIIEDDVPKVLFLKQKNQALYELEGRVVEIGNYEKGKWIKVKIGNNLVEIPIKEEDNFSNNDNVKVVFGGQRPFIK